MNGSICRCVTYVIRAAIHDAARTLEELIMAPAVRTLPPRRLARVGRLAGLYLPGGCQSSK